MSGRGDALGVRWTQEDGDSFNRFWVGSKLEGILGHYTGPVDPVGYWLWSMHWGPVTRFSGELTVQEARDTAQVIWRLGP
jgi:hypothetical protein